jgi:hypothetical protein
MNSNITDIITLNNHKMIFQNYKIPGCYLKFLGRTLIWFGCFVILYIHVHWYFYWECEYMFIFFLLPQNICQLIFLTYIFVYIFIMFMNWFNIETCVKKGALKYSTSCYWYSRENVHSNLSRSFKQIKN